jgi:hypothetical protein
LILTSGAGSAGILGSTACAAARAGCAGCFIRSTSRAHRSFVAKLMILGISFIFPVSREDGPWLLQAESLYGCRFWPVCIWPSLTEHRPSGMD